MSCVSIRSDLATAPSGADQGRRSAGGFVGGAGGPGIVNLYQYLGKQHGAVAIHELLRAILQDEPLEDAPSGGDLSCRRASLYELWMLCGAVLGEVEERMEQDLALARQCADTVVGAICEGQPVMCLSTPHSLRETEAQYGRILSCALRTSGCCCCAMQRIVQYDKLPESILLTPEQFGGCQAYFPTIKGVPARELELAASCRKRVDEGDRCCGAPCRWRLYRPTGNITISLIRLVFTFWTATAALPGLRRCCFFIKNYRSTSFKIADLLGYRLGKMPETIELYRAPRFTGSFMSSLIVAIRNASLFVLGTNSSSALLLPNSMLHRFEVLYCPILWFGLRICPRERGVFHA